MPEPLSSLRGDPFALLCAMDARLRVARAELDAGGGEVWTGVAVRVRTRWFVVPRLDVREILPPPAVTRVPGAQPFLLGVANLRGALLPVTDLGSLLGMGMAPEQRDQRDQRDQRVVVLNSSRIPAGFLVDAVGGYRSFVPQDQRHALAAESVVPRDWLLGVFVREAQTWPVLSLQRIARSDAFVRAGAEPVRAAAGGQG